MGRAPCCDKANVKRGPWSPEEDATLKEYMEKHGTGGNWIALPQKAGLKRCGKSCRLRWLNYLRPNIKHGEFTNDEDRIICSLFASIGSRWSIIAAQLPGRTDNDIKNYWNTKLKKKLLGMVPSTQHHKRPHLITYPLQSINHNTSLIPNSSLASPYSSLYESGNNNYYSSMAFTTLISPNSTAPCMLQSQDVSLGIDYVNNNSNNNKVKQHCKNTNLFIFGGEAASCSSSDGSCITNHISQGKDQVEQDHGFSSTPGDQNILFQSCFGNGANENHKFLNCNGYEAEEKAGCFSENPLDYSIEEIKQLISTNNNICSSNNLNFLVDEIKTEEKELYY